MQNYPYGVFGLIVFVLHITLVGCDAGNGENLDANGFPIQTTETTSNAADDQHTQTFKQEQTLKQRDILPTLASIQEHVFSPICVQCHGATSPAAGQNLSTINASIENLIGVDASNTAFKRVAPFDAASSYLMLKIKGDVIAGSRMPLGLPPLSNNAIEAIETWINNGAQFDDTLLKTNQQTNQQTVQAASVSEQFQITQMRLSSAWHTDSDTSSVPTADRLLTEPSALIHRLARHTLLTRNLILELSIHIEFNQAVDFTSIIAEQIILDIAQPQYQQVQYIQLQDHHLTPINQTTLEINLQLNEQALNALIFDEHTTKHDPLAISIRLNQSSISTVVAVNGEILDGDYDGKSGGEFSYEFIQ